MKELHSEADDLTLANPFGPTRRGCAAVMALNFASSRMSDGEIGDRDSLEPFDFRVTTTFRREAASGRSSTATPIQSPPRTSRGRCERRRC
jgi:hypothetical protein